MMNREAVARELVKLARELAGAGEAGSRTTSWMAEMISDIRTGD